MAALPQAKRDLIVQLFEGGLTNKTELARQAGVSKPTVYRVLVEEDLYEPPDEADELEDEYEEDYEAEEDDELESAPAPLPPQALASMAAGFVVGFAACYLMLKGRPNLPPSPQPPGASG